MFPFYDTAPTNDAFLALPAGTLEYLFLPENVDQLTRILKYHVVSANAHSSTLSNGDFETLSGDPITVAVSGMGVKINDASVVIPDIIASNGIIHVIDTVLIPPSLGSIYDIGSNTEGFSTLGKCSVF